MIYGRTFEAYQLIHTLSSCGVPGTQIALALPPLVPTSVSASPPTTDDDPMNEPAISAAVLSTIKELGVMILPDHVLAQWDTVPSAGGGFRNRIYPEISDAVVLAVLLKVC